MSTSDDECQAFIDENKSVLGWSAVFFGWLQDAVSKLLYNKLALDSVDVGTMYFCRGLHGLLTLIFVICAVSAIMEFTKENGKYRTERKEWAVS